ERVWGGGAARGGAGEGGGRPRDGADGGTGHARGTRRLERELEPVVRRAGRVASDAAAPSGPSIAAAPSRSTGSPWETSTISTGRSRTGASASRSSATVIL